MNSKLLEMLKHLYVTAVQDSDGVRAGRKGYRMRYDEVPEQMEKAIRQAVGEEMMDYGNWLKPQCDLHEKYTSACCGCQKARAVFNEIENYQSWIKEWQGGEDA